MAPSPDNEAVASQKRPEKEDNPRIIDEMRQRAREIGGLGDCLK